MFGGFMVDMNKMNILKSIIRECIHEVTGGIVSNADYISPTRLPHEPTIPVVSEDASNSIVSDDLIEIAKKHYGWQQTGDTSFERNSNSRERGTEFLRFVEDGKKTYWIYEYWNPEIQSERYEHFDTLEKALSDTQ